ncbi:MAG: Gfo/Idh/MocA family protein [Acidobacteriaceae bacterium]
MNPHLFNRRTFLEAGTKSILAGAAAKFTVLSPQVLSASNSTSANDTIRFALIGSGVRGSQLLQASLSLPNVECVAVSDLYDDRLLAAQEYAHKSLVTTRNFHEVLDRKDIDAVIVAVTDYQHARVVTAACTAGKDVYCEKPMSHTVEQGFEMIDAAQTNKRILQVGSQRVSSILYAKAREIYASGALGEVYAIEAYTDRNSASGAWDYPIPPGANEQAISWNTFLIGAPKIPFSAPRFFRWRGYRGYGEGLPGDLYVHLLSGIYFVTGMNTAPSRAYSTGGLFRWKDGRDQPDLLETLYDYPNFRVGIRCNSNSNAGEMIGFYGTNGTLEIRGPEMTFTPYVTTPTPETYSTIGWSAMLRNEYLAKWHAEHPASPLSSYKLEEQAETYVLPPHYRDVVDHEAHFFHSIRTRTAPVENEIFGNNTAIACHMANASYFERAVAVWDESARKIKT